MRKIYFLFFTVFVFLAATQRSLGQYCNVTFPSGVEPITLVTFGTINNPTTNALGGTALENFTAMSTSVFKEQSYPIVVKGNTDGNFTDHFYVYFDWNHDNDFTDPGEEFYIGFVTNSTGLPAAPQQATANIMIPAWATDGPTRMRVVKKFFSGTPATALSCNTTGFGQAEDYTVDVLAPPPCAGPLSGGTVSGPASVCSGVNFTLTVAGSSFGSGLTYQWESSPDGSTWTPVGGQTGTSLTTSQAAATYYRRKLTCSGVDEWSTAIQVTLNPVDACYCTSNATNTSFEFIGRVTITGGIDNTSAVSGYTNFTSQVATVYQGQPITVSVYKGATNWYGTDRAYVFVDFNHDGDFTDPNELVGSGSGNTSPYVINFTVDPSAVIGNTRIRIKFGDSDAFAAAPINTSPCQTYTYGETEDYTLNITAPPPCTDPTGLSVSALGTTGVTLNWIASTPAPANGYEWEIRTSGAAGSGATGLAASGSVAAGIVTANATGLTSNTAYTYYVRSVCATGSLYSQWSAGFNFRTLCDPINTFPFTETFETASPTRSCWGREIITGAFNWTYGAGAGNGGVTTAHGGSVNAQYFGSFYGAETAILISPQLDLSSLTSGADLEFWMINPSWLGDINELRVYYKTSAAGPWMPLPGGTFTSAVGAWTKVEITDLPNISSTYYIGFEGTQLWGYGVGIDDVTIKAAPSCRVPTNVSAVGITADAVEVSFTSPGTAFIVEYGAVGFTPGTGNTAGTGGTLVFATSSPVTINTGLTPNTIYDFYVRQVCVPGAPGDYSANVLTRASTLCSPVNIPYAQDFESALPPAMPTCTSVQDMNGSSGVFYNTLANGGAWETTNNLPLAPAAYTHSPITSLIYAYDANDLTRPADDWFYIQGLNLTGGQTYRLKFFYKGGAGPTWFEKLEVKYGTAATASAMANVLYSNTNIITNFNNPWDSVRVDFTPAATGVYYIGFHAFSDADNAYLMLDDISVRIAPVVDAGITGITAVPTCPAGNGVINAIIRNYNLTTLNFATHPVTITGTLTGAASGTITATINTGTLAPGITDTFPLSGFNYIAGLYNITVASSSPADPETGNDAYTTTFYVNPSPAVANVTPAAPVICVGDVVQLNTQFTTPPPAPVTHPVVSSGTIAVAIPDNSPAGVTHTLSVSGVPAGASVLGISVTLNVSHTWINDLQINLRSPHGKVLNLFNRKGGLFEANLVNTVISSSATAPIPTTGAPFTGIYTADGATGVGATVYPSNVGSFTELYGPANGNWTLSLRDNAALDVGTLTSWSITITYGFPHPLVTWAPATGLFTNAAATVAYTGTSANSLYAKPQNTTTYTVTTTDAVTGCTSTRDVVVTVNPLPVINIAALPVRICVSDQEVPLTATPVGGTWSGIGISGNSFLPPLTAAVGTYTLTYTYTDANGCTNTASINAPTEDCPERMILLRDNAVSIFPNPNDGQFTVKMNSTLYNKLTLRVYTANGNLIHTRELSGLFYGRTVPVDLRYLPSGTYMVQLSYIGGPRTSEKAFKIIIAR